MERRQSPTTLLALAIALVACSTSDPLAPGPGGGGSGDGNGEQPAEPALPDAAAEQVVRFIAVGDTGKGNEAQYAVAEAMREKCEADGCDFVVLLGDNVYDDGISSVDDPQWQTKFEEPYADLDLPFYAVLGNHDYNKNGLSSDWSQGPMEVEYTKHSAKWIMPDTFYTFTAGPVGFIMLDTNSLFWDSTENGDQEEWYPTALSQVSDATWVIAAGHHPYRSNGRHGDAGNYEAQVVGDQEIPNPVSPVNGAHIEAFFDDHVCGSVDFYLAGHDHNRQWIDDPAALCGTELVVSGAGATTTELELARNEVHFEDYDQVGFFYVVADETSLEGQFIGVDGTLDFERTVTR